MIRRALDIVVSLSALVLTAPVLALAMLAIRLESPGPVLYRQRRAGRAGARFDVLKLRTMVDGAEHVGAGLAVDANDSRITRVGAFLRRTSLDELPNLVNVLRGEMSLIGPRPDVAGAGGAVHRRASAVALPSSPGSPAGPRSTGGRPCPGRSGSSSTSTTSSTARWRSTCRFSGAPPRSYWAVRASTREPAVAGRESCDPARDPAHGGGQAL